MDKNQVNNEKNKFMRNVNNIQINESQKRLAFRILLTVHIDTLLSKYFDAKTAAHIF